MKTVEVSLSPELLNGFQLSGKIAVVVDILRATSCMTVGIGSGVKEIRPYASLDACMRMKEKGFVIAGERNGLMMEGFDMGNSPFEYMQEKLHGSSIAVSTTNGTVAIERSAEARQIVIASFLNISAITDYLLNQNNSIVIVCAGWKGRVNLEDTLFAGALTDRLIPNFKINCDATLLAQCTWRAMNNDLLANILASSHAHRLKRLGIESDISYCLKEDEFTCCPVLQDGSIRGN